MSEFKEGFVQAGVFLLDVPFARNAHHSFIELVAATRTRGATVVFVVTSEEIPGACAGWSDFLGRVAPGAIPRDTTTLVMVSTVSNVRGFNFPSGSMNDGHIRRHRRLLAGRR